MAALSGLPADVKEALSVIHAGMAEADRAYAARCFARLNRYAEGYMRLLDGSPDLQRPFLSVMAYVQEAERRLRNG